MIRIKMPSLAPEFVDSVWSRILRDMASAMEGSWGQDQYRSYTQSNNLNVSLYQVVRQGKLVFISIVGVSTSGQSGTISLPVDAIGNTALSSINCKASIQNNQIVIDQITGQFTISGVYASNK